MSSKLRTYNTKMADDKGDLRIGGKLLKDLRVKDLKEELETRGLPKVGHKTQLVARLKSVRFF